MGETYSTNPKDESIILRTLHFCIEEIVKEASCPIFDFAMWLKKICTVFPISVKVATRTIALWAKELGK